MARQYLTERSHYFSLGFSKMANLTNILTKAISMVISSKGPIKFVYFPQKTKSLTLDLN